MRACRDQHRSTPPCWSPPSRPDMLIDELAEAPYMQRTFPQSAYWDLDWDPRATFSAFGRIWLLDPADRAAHRAGARYPSDVLR